MRTMSTIPSMGKRPIDMGVLYADQDMLHDVVGAILNIDILFSVLHRLSV